MITYAIDPGTLDEVFPDTDAVLDRIRHLDMRMHQGGRTLEWFDWADELIILQAAVNDMWLLGSAVWAVEWAKASDEYVRQRRRAEARLGNVYQRLGNFAEANMTFLELLIDAHSFGPELESLTHHLAGRNDYAQQLWDDAREHFAHALAIREKMSDPAAIAESTLALRAAERRC